MRVRASHAPTNGNARGCQANTDTAQRLPAEIACRYHIATMRTIYSVRDALMRKTASLVVVLASIVGVHTSVRAQRMDSAMVGAWAGRAQVAVPWSQQRELEVRVLIRHDGSVSGTIGDAQLIDGRFSNARGPAGRALRIGREYAIAGGLSGPVIRSEAVQRASVRVSLDWKGHTFEGELQTSGTPDGSSADMALGATGLVLHRVSTAVSLRTGTWSRYAARVQSRALRISHIVTAWVRAT